MGFVWVVFNRNKRGWHDYLAGSMVVYGPVSNVFESGHSGKQAAGAGRLPVSNLRVWSSELGASGKGRFIELTWKHIPLDYFSLTHT